MIHQLLSPPSNRRFFTLFRPAFLELRKFLGADVALEQQWRLISTATACEIPNNVKNKKKVVSTNERKNMVEAYIDEYRVMNAGKFPTTTNVMKHVGGSYYKVRAILQKYEYGCKLSAVATAAKNSTTGQIARVNVIFDGKAAPDCQSSEDRITVVEDCGIPELDSSCEVVVDKCSRENMVDASTLNKHHERTTGFVSGCERNADLELGRESDKTSSDKDVSNKNNILEIQGVPVTSSLVDTLANETLMAFATDDPEFPAKPDHHTEVTGMSRNWEAGEIDKSADQAFASDEFLRCEVMDTRNVSIVLSDKKQVGDSYHNSGAIIQDLDKTMVGAEMKRTSDIEKTLDRQVSVDRIATMDDGHVSTDNDSSSQIEADNYSCQKVIDESILIENEEVTAYDGEKSEDLNLKREHQITSSTDVDGSNYNGYLESKELSQQPSLVMDTSAVSLKGTATENSEVSAKPSLPSEVPGTSQNPDIDETVASAQSLNSGGISRGTTVQQSRDEQLRKSSLWGNVKLLASNIIRFWRKV